MRKNTIAVPETGAGKTLIAVMLMKEFGKRLIVDGQKMMIIFLASTVNLVNQDYTELDVVEYCGAQRIGEWSTDCWEKNVKTRDVVVMIPQILLDALRRAFQTLDTVQLIVFDECHCARGNHPYARIMKEFYHDTGCKPTIFGMTASPVGGKDYNELIKTEVGYAMGTKNGFISSKLDKLVEISQSLRLEEEVYCLILMERVITSKVIERFMRKINITPHFPVSYLTGGGSSKDSLTPKLQRTVIDSFRAGKVNFLLTTDIAEEGVDIPNCSCVIHFDLPKTVCSYVQSRGRARQVNSSFILMLERGNDVQKDKIFDIIGSENYLGKPSSRDNKTFLSNGHGEEIDVYCVKTTGATVTAESSINLIYKFCEKLPKDRYFIPKPFFELYEKDGSYECSLTLPPNAAFQKIIGPMSCSSNSAKQLVSLKAFKKLHQLGALSNHLLPFHEDPQGSTFSGAGTTKRKELHGMTSVHALCGSWAHKPDNVTLNAYKVHFVCDQEGENYSDFVLLVGSSLDDDVASAEIVLSLIPNKVITSYVSPCGKVHLSAEQVEKSKLFQEFFFNGIFGRMFTGSRSSGSQREFLFREGHMISWSSMNMYLLLPLESSSNDNGFSIYWNGIHACVAIVEYLRKIYSTDDEYHSGNSTTSCTSPCETNGENAEIVQLANKSLHIKYLKNSVVFSIHNGRIYSVLDVINDVTPEDPFDDSCGMKPSQFVSFIDYYHQKYNIVLHYPQQPLLLLKQSHNPHNLLLKSRSEDASTGDKAIMEKEQIHARLPPELLVHIDLSTDILKSFYLLPSVMHRLETLMLASQLRKEIGYNDLLIPSSLILEAMTTLRCCENFSLERLELLGDSVLKYAVSCHLFLKYPKKHEGQLSDCRSQAVCNSTLHKLGTGRSIQGYIRDSAFDPRRWLAPGQISIRPFPCICGIDTCNVPLEGKYMTEEISVVVGKPCDKGHRWMCSKTIADCVEALVGAYYAGGGLPAALQAMRWLGVDIKMDKVLVEEAKKSAFHWYHLSKVSEIEFLESKLNYMFTVKGLLLEAITHPSLQELGLDYCYQRLEFLGDSVLDLLITWHHFLSHKNIDPGVLTDLRSASVNNENFAQVAVRNNFDNYLRHSSGILSEQIKDYVTRISSYHCFNDMLLPVFLPKAPKVLGDIVESIAGAILIDTYLNLDAVWDIFKSLFSPIVTPDNLELPPIRELSELCSYFGYFIHTKSMKNGEEVLSELTVQLKDDLLVGCGRDKNMKTAKAQAALCLLKQLKTRGISHGQSISKRKQDRYIFSDNSFLSTTYVRNTTSKDNGYLENNSKLTKAKLNNPVHPITLPMRMDKGGPRTALFKLCRILQWPMPEFESREENFRTPITLNGVKTPNFNLFTTKISLHIPNSKVLTLTGEQRTDKKSAQDSAALVLLLELKKQEVCILEEP
uniref:Uncharacterized protein n=1 Tax=Musa acuminata subsp. malaccensis TaxID=214687 RepID=A0A804J326_MUSAM